MPRVLVVLAAAALVLVGCGDDDDTGDDDATATTTSAPATTATTAAPGDLPGERVDIFPRRGARLAVVGVAADDTLNVRSGPGTPFAVLFELPPLATDAMATGHNRSLDGGGLWAEITVGGHTGWANTAFLLQPGRVDDITSALFPAPSDRPRSETMLELGRTVARMRASEEPPSRIVVVDGPTVGDLGEITVDVIGLGDDAVGGERLKVLAEPDPGGESFTVRTVEATTLCSRGVTDDGVCL